MNDWTTAPFGTLYALPSKNGLTAPSRVRGKGVALINMREIFAHDRIESPPMELAPLPEVNSSAWLVQEGDLLFARQSLVFEGAGKCVLVEQASIQRTFESNLIRVRLDRSRCCPEFYFYYFKSPAGKGNMATIVEQVAAAGIRSSDLAALDVPVPPIAKQRAIAATIGALDEKIEANRRTSELMRQLGKAEVNARIGERRSILSDLVLSISRGVTPQYADGDPGAPLVLNQRCIRNNRISVDVARHMHDRNVAKVKRVFSGDILVNSTGTGTLGRVGRWHQGSTFADSHISIVKPDASKIGPTVLAYLMFDRESDIEDMATGSTGQTELSPLRLGQLELALPSSEDVNELEPILAVLEERMAGLQDENNHLAAIRDTLPPELLSGRIRVPEAEGALA